MIPEEEKASPSSWAEGALSVLSVLEHDSRPVEEILLLPEAKKDERNIARLLKLAKARRVPLSLSTPDFFSSVTTGHTHGGVIARVGERRMDTVEGVFEKGNGFVFLLCGIEDPFNFGTAVRSLYAAGAGGMILSPRNWLSAAGVVIRSSAGLSEAVNCAVYDSAPSLVDAAHKAGYRIVCASEKDSVDLFKSDLKLPLFLIVGGEKRGISRDLSDRADLKIRIPYGRRFTGSLTTSAAASVAAFEVFRQNRRETL